MEADNQESIELNSQPAVRAVDALMGAFQRLNSEVIKTNSLVSEQLAKTEKFRNANLQGASQLQAEMRQFLLSMKENTRIQNTIGQAVSTPSVEATLRNAEQLRQQREDQYLRTREARIDLLNRKIALANGSERENLRIKQQRLVVDGEELKLARGETNEYVRQKALLDRMLQTQRQQTAEQRRQLQLTQMQAAVQSRDDIAARAGVGLAIARERVVGSGAAETFGIQTALTANFFIVTQLMAAMRFATAFVVDFDRALFNLQAITSSTDGTMASFRRTIEEVANSTKFTAVEVAQAAQVLGQAGFTALEVQQALGAVAQYASATGIQISEAVDLMTSAISVFNMTASEATNVANTFTAAINNSKLTQQQLGLAFSYVANTANQSGLAFTELTATLAGLANAGIRSGSTIGTNLRALIIDLQSPSEELIETLRALGLSMYDIDLSANGLIGVIQNLRAAGFGASEAFETLETRSAAAFLALSGQADTLAGIQRALIGTEAASEASDTQMQSLANTLANFQSVVGTLALNTFEPVVRGLQDFFEATNGVLIGLNELIAEVPIVADMIHVFGAALIGLGAAAFVNVIGRITGFNVGLGAIPAAARGATRSVNETAVSVRNFAREQVALQTSVIRSTGALRALTAVFPLMTANVLATNLGARVLAGGIVLLRGAFTALGGPIGIFITALTLLPMIMSSVSNEAQELDRALDDARTQLDSTRAAFEENSNVIRGLGEELDALRQQEFRLRNSQDALRTKAAELVDTYGELGINLNSLEATYDDVVAAVYRLRDAHIAEQAAAAEAAQTASVRTQNAIRDRIVGTEFEAYVDPDRPRSTGRGVINQFARESAGRDDLSTARSVFRLFNELQDRLETASPEDARAMASEFASVTLNNAINELRTAEGLDLDSDALLALRGGMESLRGQLNELVRTIEASETFSDLVTVRRRAAEDEPQALLAEAERLRGIYNAALNAFDQNRTFNREAYERGDYQAAFGPVDQRLNSDPRYREQLLVDQVGSVSAEIVAFAERLFGDGSVLDETTQAALRALDIEAKLALDPAELASRLTDVQEQSIEASEAVVRVAIRAARENVQSRIENLNQTRNPEELAAAQAELDAAIARYAALRMRQAYLSLGFSDNDISRGIDTSSFSDIQNEALAEARNDISAFQSARDERVETRAESIASNLRNERIGSIGREIRNLERSLRSVLQDRPVGSGRTTLDQVLVQQLAIIDRLEELERQRLQIEAMDRNLTPDTVAARERDIAADFEDRRADALREYEEEFREGSARTFREAVGDLFEVLSDEYLSEAATEAQTFASTFRDTMLAAVEATNRGFQRFFYDISTGAETVGGAFRNLAYSILDSMLQVITNKIAQQFVSMLLNVGFAAIGGSFGGVPAGGKGQVMPAWGGTVSFWQGGQIPGIRNAYQGTYTRDSMLIHAAPGEYVLRQQAVKAIGKDTLDEINALGNRTISKSSAGMKPIQMPPPQSTTTNVWLVTEDQAPPMGPNDVIAIVTRDGMTGGPIKRLIKTVTQGGI